MGFGLTLQTAPTSEPVSLAEAKHQTGTDGLDNHDVYLTSLITAARQVVERRLNRSLITTTWNLALDRFPVGVDPILLPMSPLQSITSITYLDTAGASQTWSSAYYRVTVSREPGRVVPIYGQSYPSTYPTTDAITVRFVAGYGAATAVPAALKSAMLLLITEWFENRSLGGVVSDKVGFSFNSLLQAYDTGDEFACYGLEGY